MVVTFTQFKTVNISLTEGCESGLSMFVCYFTKLIFRNALLPTTEEKCFRLALDLLLCKKYILGFKVSFRIIRSLPDSHSADGFGQILN